MNGDVKYIQGKFYYEQNGLWLPASIARRGNGGGGRGAQGAQGGSGSQGAQGSSGSSSYSVYTGLVSQSWTSAPTFTLNENSVGTISWAYTFVGVYRGTLTGAFLTGKVLIFMGENQDFSTGWRRLTDNIIEISCYDNTHANADDLFNKTSFELRAYP